MTIVLSNFYVKKTNKTSLVPEDTNLLCYLTSSLVWKTTFLKKQEHDIYEKNFFRVLVSLWSFHTFCSLEKLFSKSRRGVSLVLDK